MKKAISALCVLSLFISLNSCIFFSTYQSAKMLDKHGIEATAIISKQQEQDITYESDEPDRDYQYGIQAAYGFSKRFNLRTRFIVMKHVDVLTDSWNYVSKDGEEDKEGEYYSNYLEFEPKFGVGSKDRIALTFPVGLIFEDESTDFQLMPTAIFSLHPTEWLSTTLAVKAPYIVTESVILGAFTTGLTFTSTKIPVTITPEFGFRWGDNQKFTSWGIAFGFLKQ